MLNIKSSVRLEIKKYQHSKKEKNIKSLMLKDERNRLT